MLRKSFLVTLFIILALTVFPKDAHAISTFVIKEETPNGDILNYSYKIIKEPNINDIGEVDLGALWVGEDFDYITDKRMNITIPETIEFQSAKYKVTELSGYLFYKFRGSIHIPASIEKLDYLIFSNCNFESITIDKNNPLYKDVDNCIYSIDGKKAYYIDIPESGYVKVIEGVEEIMRGAFFDDINYFIKELILPSTLKMVRQDLFNIPIIEFKGKNPPEFISDSDRTFNGRNPKILVPKGCKNRYLNSKSIKDNKFLNDQSIYFDSIKNLNKTTKFLDSISTKNKLKSAVTIPKDITSKQWDIIVNKSNEITSGISTQEGKAKAIYNWIVTNFTYDYSVWSDVEINGRTFYSSIMESDYDESANNKSYIAFRNQKGINSGFANATNALMRAAGVPCFIIEPEGINSLSINSNYANIVYYNNAWHLIDTASGCVKRIDDYHQYENNNYLFLSFDISWKLWYLKHMSKPEIIDKIF